MDVRETIAALCAIPGRGAGTDAERRAAVTLGAGLEERGHEPEVRTQWLRPGWAPAVALGTLIAAAASLVGVGVPLAGAIAAGLAAAGLAVEATGRSGPLRVVSRRRATQTIVCEPQGDAEVELLVCAAYDAPRRGLLLNHRWRAAGARLRNVRAWVAGCALAVCVACVVRLAGVDALWLGIAQLIPTIVLIAAFAAAVDIGLSELSPGADAASAAAVALALHEELAAEPPAALAPGLILAGAGASGTATLRAALKRLGVHPRQTVVIEIGPCSGGAPAWAARHPQLRRAAGTAAEALGALGLQAPHRGSAPHGAGRVPAIRIACLDGRGVAPRAHQPDDTADAVEPAAADGALDLALGVVDALDAELAQRFVSRG